MRRIIFLLILLVAFLCNFSSWAENKVTLYCFESTPSPYEQVLPEGIPTKELQLDQIWIQKLSKPICSITIPGQGEDYYLVFMLCRNRKALSFQAYRDGEMRYWLYANGIPTVVSRGEMWKELRTIWTQK